MNLTKMSRCVGLRGSKHWRLPSDLSEAQSIFIPSRAQNIHLMSAKTIRDGSKPHKNAMFTSKDST